MSLFDKLSKMAPGPSPSPTPPPTAPADPAPAMFTKGQSNPAEPDIHSPRDPLARGPGSGKPLLDKLREVGEVNPPAPARAPAPEPVAASEPIPAVDGNTCPHCRQTFKVLARHKCKGAPASAPAPEPAGPRKLFCAFCGEEISDLPSHLMGCKRTPAPAPTRSAPGPAAPLPVPTVGEYIGETPVRIPPREAVSAPEPSFHGFGPEPVAAPEPYVDPRYPESAPAPEPVKDEVLRWNPEPSLRGFGPEAAPAPAPTPSARHIEELTSGNVTERSALDGYVLFLDVLFEKNEFDPNGLKHFSDIVSPLADMVARENKTAHWGTVEYNRGGSLLAAKLEGWIKHVNPVGVILADGSTPECRVCKEVLKRYAKVVVQGVR